jgi:hypothetical protein
MQLRFSSELWQDVHKYLDDPRERALFLFTQEIEVGSDVWQPVDDWFLDPATDYDETSELHVALAPHVMPAVFKRAHDAGAAVVEVHGHYWSGYGTRLSPYDVAGLEELVPQMLWRLPGRPYFALVVGMDSFDGLVWTNRDEALVMQPLLVGSEQLAPTGASIRLWQRRIEARW